MAISDERCRHRRLVEDCAECADYDALFGGDPDDETEQVLVATCAHCGREIHIAPCGDGPDFVHEDGTRACFCNGEVHKAEPRLETV